MTLTDERPITDEYLMGDPSMIHVPVPTSQTVWGKLDALLGNRAERCAPGLRNTRIFRRGPGEFSPIAVRYHWTDVVTARVDGTVELETGGWRTYTTKERINCFLPAFTIDGVRVRVTLSQDHGVWRLGRIVSRYDRMPEDVRWEARLHDYWMGEELAEFHNGIMLDARGMVVPS